MYLVSFALSLLLILLAIAFFTLFERKLLGYVHIRYGPNRVGPLGLLQPIGDAIKLFIKGGYSLHFGNILLYYFCPFWALFLMCVLWGFYPYWGGLILLKMGFVVFFCIISLEVYFLLLSGWVSGAKYSLLGAFRSSAQSISYEIIFIFFILIFLMVHSMYSELDLFKMGHSQSKFYSFFIIFFVWVFLLMAEANRTPFDFSEGESELVSGFNTEYSSGLFSLIFIAEYGLMLFFSCLSTMLVFSLKVLWLKVCFMVLIYVWVRSSFPRSRYDFLMNTSWVYLLPFCLLAFVYYMFIF